MALIRERACHGASSVARFHLCIFSISGGIAFARLRTAPRITEHLGHGVLIFGRHHVIVKVEVVIAMRFHSGMKPEPWPQVKDVVIWIVPLQVEQ